MGAWICLAPRCHVTVATYSLKGNVAIVGLQLPRQSNQRLILGVAERLIIGAFKFDAYRKIVTSLAALETGNTRMPGTVQTRDKLRNLTVALNQKMRTDSQLLDGFKKGCSSGSS